MIAISKEARVFLTSLGVLPEYQRRGYGRQILIETAYSLVVAGWEHVMLEVQTDNRNALSLYEACGFDETTTYGFYEVEA